MAIEKILISISLPHGIKKEFSALQRQAIIK